MRLGSPSFWFFLGTTVLSCALLTHEARAGWASVAPTADRVVVTVRGNFVTNVQATKGGVAVGGIRGVGTKVVADLPFACSGGSTIFRYVARSVDSEEPAVIGMQGGTSLSVPVTLGTGAEFAALCGGTNAGTKTFHMLTILTCTKPGAIPDFDNGMHSIQVIVACDPNYRVPTQSTPVRYRHSCPAGFSVGTTGQQIAETNDANSLCVKNGTASGPKG